MKSLALTIAGLILAVVGFELGGSWPHDLGTILGWAGTLASSVGALLQYRDSRPFTHAFSELDWQGSGREFTLYYPAWRHGKADGASVIVFRNSGASFEEVIVDVASTSSGGIVIEAVAPFAGKVTIKQWRT